MDLDGLAEHLEIMRSPATPLFAVVVPRVEANMQAMNHFIQMGCWFNEDSAPLAGRTVMCFTPNR